MPSITSEATFDLGGLADPISLFGHRDQNLNALEALIPVVLRLDGDRVYVSGDQRAVRRAEEVLAAVLAAASARYAAHDRERVCVSGVQRAVRRAEEVLAAMLAAARAGTQVTPDDVALAARASGERGIPPTIAVTARGRE